MNVDGILNQIPYDLWKDTKYDEAVRNRLVELYIELDKKRDKCVDAATPPSEQLDETTLRSKWGELIRRRPIKAWVLLWLEGKKIDWLLKDTNDLYTFLYLNHLGAGALHDPDMLTLLQSGELTLNDIRVLSCYSRDTLCGAPWTVYARDEDNGKGVIFESYSYVGAKSLLNEDVKALIEEGLLKKKELLECKFTALECLKNSGVRELLRKGIINTSQILNIGYFGHRALLDEKLRSLVPNEISVDQILRLDSWTAKNDCVASKSGVSNEETWTDKKILEKIMKSEESVNIDTLLIRLCVLFDSFERYQKKGWHYPSTRSAWKCDGMRSELLDELKSDRETAMTIIRAIEMLSLSKEVDPLSRTNMYDPYVMDGLIAARKNAIAVVTWTQEYVTNSKSPDPKRSINQFIAT